MHVMYAQNVHALLNEVETAANEFKVERRRIELIGAGRHTELSMAIAIALSYQIKTGEA